MWPNYNKTRMRWQQLNKLPKQTSWTVYLTTGLSCVSVKNGRSKTRVRKTKLYV